MVYREKELMHYGVKGMKWHKHLKRHEEPLLDRLGRDEKKDLEEAKKIQRRHQEMADEDKRWASEKLRKARDYEKHGFPSDRTIARARNNLAWSKRYQEEADKDMRKVKIAQWRYDKTVMGKIDKGKKKVAELLKRGFKK